MSSRSYRGRFRPSHAVAVLAAVALFVDAPPATASDPQGSPPSITIAPLNAGEAGRTVVTLITGDRLTLSPTENGRQAVEVAPAPRPSGFVPEFEMTTEGDRMYVIPSDAVPMIPDRLDPELFNVTKLVDYGYTDGVPVLVTDAPSVQKRAQADAGMTAAEPLRSIDGYAATVEPDGKWWASAADDLAPAGDAKVAPAAAGGEKVWLDEIVTVDLAESVPMIGAPEAWENGLDGTGVTVAVLDTGIDANHPDLAGKVVDSRNFTAEADIRDGHGHGTHVAGTIAGTGAGSDGRYTGVAPGAKLLVGKICTSAGTCPTSSAITAMEWAAQQVDVVSMSIGSSIGSTGTDPFARAVNDLTAEYDTLFVIAAGNIGTQGPGSIESPGSADAALTVGAVDKNKQLASFSSRGPRLGDYAIKPDITAPGVGIVAPRADGTAMGSPVNDRYTSANGTSMATPHVSGAAALVLQRYPNLHAAELKSLLVSTAEVNPDLTVYEQGGGLLQVPAALAAPVVANPTMLQLGRFAFPQADLDPVTKTVTYTNRTDRDVTVELSLTVKNENGAAAPGDSLSVRDMILTVPAGGTADTTVTLNPAAVPAGTYGGYLTATTGGTQLHTPVGFSLEPEMYTITVRGTDRSGRPATGSGVYLIDVNSETSDLGYFTFSNGVMTTRVPAGTYTAWGDIRTYGGHLQQPQDHVTVGFPPTTINADFEVSLDARKAKPVTVETPKHPDATYVNQNNRLILDYKKPNGSEFRSVSIFPANGMDRQQYVLESGPVRVGEFEYTPELRLAAPVLALAMVEPTRTDLYAHPLNLGQVPVDSTSDLPLTFVGDGREEDYQGLDVTGHLVLAKRHWPERDVAAQEAIARAHGAKALAVMNDTTGFFKDQVGSATKIPVMALSGADGQVLLDQLDKGPVTMRLSGTVASPYVYDMVLPHAGGLPDGVHHVVDYDKVATLRNNFHGQGTKPLWEYRIAWRPYQQYSLVLGSPLWGARHRIEYINADSATVYQQEVHAQSQYAVPLREPDTTYSPGEKRDQQWYAGPMAPTISETVGVRSDAPDARSPAMPVERDGDTITMPIQSWSDNNSPAHTGPLDPSADTAQLRVYRNGDLIGTAPDPAVRIQNLDPEAATYRFEVDTARSADWWPTSTRTSTAWTVRSGHTETATNLPFLLLGYDTQLDLTNTASHPSDRKGPAEVTIGVHHQKGSKTSSLAGMRVWVSYDDGKTWQSRPVKDGEKGKYRAILNSPGAADTPTGYASLKVEAWDTSGNRVEQQIIRAWRLAEH